MTYEMIIRKLMKLEGVHQSWNTEKKRRMRRGKGVKER